VIQHLATFNKILLTKGDFRIKGAQTSFLFLAGALRRTPLGELRRSGKRRRRLRREISFAYFPPLNAFGISMSGLSLL